MLIFLFFDRPAAIARFPALFPRNFKRRARVGLVQPKPADDGQYARRSGFASEPSSALFGGRGSRRERGEGSMVAGADRRTVVRGESASRSLANWVGQKLPVDPDGIVGRVVAGDLCGHAVCDDWPGLSFVRDAGGRMFYRVLRGLDCAS